MVVIQLLTQLLFRIIPIDSTVSTIVFNGNNFNLLTYPLKQIENRKSRNDLLC